MAFRITNGPCKTFSRGFPKPEKAQLSLALGFYLRARSHVKGQSASHLCTRCWLIFQSILELQKEDLQGRWGGGVALHPSEPQAVGLAGFYREA